MYVGRVCTLYVYVYVRVCVILLARALIHILREPPIRSTSGGKCDLGRQSEGCTEHAFVRCHISHFEDRDLVGVFGVAQFHPDADLYRDSLADVDEGLAIVRCLGPEAVDVDHGQLRACVRSEELLAPDVQAAEVR